MSWNDTENASADVAVGGAAESQAGNPHSSPAALPELPSGASDAVVQAYVDSEAARQRLGLTVRIVLATLGLSTDTHDIAIESGRAVVVKRP